MLRKMFGLESYAYIHSHVIARVAYIIINKVIAAYNNSDKPPLSESNTTVCSKIDAYQIVG